MRQVDLAEATEVDEQEPDVPHRLEALDENDFLSTKSHPTSHSQKAAEVVEQVDACLGLSNTELVGSRQHSNMHRDELRRRLRSLSDPYKLCIPKESFARLVRESLETVGDGKGYRITPEAMLALQCALESAVEMSFQDAQTFCQHAKRQTVFTTDLVTGLRLRARYGDRMLENLDRPGWIFIFETDFLK